ncbi:MAG: AEC family transporter [Sporolactobacillus sp.]|jgi:predicted permease|nr:AEC family transporter [Sporolactobacillus sp.]
MQLFWQVLFPVLLIFAGGFLLQKIFRLDIKPITTMAVYLLLPLLVFETFYKQPIDSRFLMIFLVTVLIMFALITLVFLIIKVFHINKDSIGALMLSTVFPNSGNFGIPVVLFAFGHQGFLYGMPVMIIHNVLMGTFGVYFAAGGKGGFRTAMRTVLSQPSNYAVIIGIAMQQLHLPVPSTIYQSIRLVGDTTIPIIMVVLGMQLATVRLKTIVGGKIGLVLLLRLIVSPLIAWGLCAAFGFSPVLSAVMVVLAAMPSAANTTMYAIQFDAQPAFVSSCTFLTTIVSFPTLAVLLNLLN